MSIISYILTVDYKKKIVAMSLLALWCVDRAQWIIWLRPYRLLHHSFHTEMTLVGSRCLYMTEDTASTRNGFCFDKSADTELFQSSRGIDLLGH